MIVTKDSISPE